MKQSKSPLVVDLTQVGRGLLMGGADIIPGVSGGTMALILGIYERLVTAVSHFDLTFLGQLRKRQWAKAAEHCDLRFLATLLCGILVGIAGLATLMHYLLRDHLELTLSAFFGLILASSLVVARSMERWNILNALFAAAGGAFAYWLVGQPFSKGAEGYAYLFLCGTVAICAMILPGISGAFILLIMGKYKFVTGVIKDLVHGKLTGDNVLVMAVFGIGCVVGLLTFSKFLRWLLARYHGQTMAVLCGFMIGSLRRIWPYKVKPGVGEELDVTQSRLSNAWPETFDAQVAAAIALAIAAAAFVLVLDWVSRRHAEKKAVQ